MVLAPVSLRGEGVLPRTIASADDTSITTTTALLAAAVVVIMYRYMYLDVIFYKRKQI